MKIRSILSLSAAAVAMAGAAGATTYNAYNDFSQTSPVWSYGYGSTGSSFTPYAFYYTNSGSDGCSVPNDSVTCGEISSAGLPEVAKITGTTQFVGSDVLVADALYMHPGPSTDSIVEFTAPRAGTYAVSGFFETLDTNTQPAGNKYLVVVNGTTTELSRVIAGQPAMGPDTVGGVAPFKFDVTLTQGQTIAFGVNDNGSFGNNGTGFDATIDVPEPATWLMMIVGLGGVGAALRLRGRAAKVALQR